MELERTNRKKSLFLGKFRRKATGKTIPSDASRHPSLCGGPERRNFAGNFRKRAIPRFAKNFFMRSGLAGQKISLDKRRVFRYAVSYHRKNALTGKKSLSDVSESRRKL